MEIEEFNNIWHLIWLQISLSLYIHTCARVCAWVCACVFMCVCVQSYVSVCISLWVYYCVCARMRACACGILLSWCPYPTTSAGRTWTALITWRPPNYLLWIVSVCISVKHQYIYIPSPDTFLSNVSHNTRIRWIKNKIVLQFRSGSLPLRLRLIGCILTLIVGPIIYQMQKCSWNNPY